MIVEHVVLGAVAIALGIAGLRYNYQLVGFTGDIGWVETHLGAGSTYAFMKFMAVLLCVGGFLFMFNLLGPLVIWILSPLAQFFPKAPNEIQ